MRLRLPEAVVEEEEEVPVAPAAAALAETGAADVIACAEIVGGA